MTVPFFDTGTGDRRYHHADERGSVTARLFKSDWISIDEMEGRRFILKARTRDLKIILSEIRPKTT